ncbi:cysteine protease ATG4D-like [Ornithodoros turicata]|uniref:cysteine protease ATG4D-like n=1 Tax=Ornithodoros turicata TaxID=34597 RepID=UPI0031398B0A
MEAFNLFVDMGSSAGSSHFYTSASAVPFRSLPEEGRYDFSVYGPPSKGHTRERSGGNIVKQRCYSSLDDINNAAVPSSSSEPPPSPEKMKARLLSVWNNVKYGWTVRTKTTFSKDAPIFLLGVMYHHKVQGYCDGVNRSFRDFMEDFASRLWFTYRRDFPAIPGTDITTDCGWGCMLRSGQMILAQALLNHMTSRQWRWNSKHSEANDFLHRYILKWFGDKPGNHFSLHELIRAGHQGGKKAGDWYGPSSVAYILKDVVAEAARHELKLKDLCIYVAQDCTVYLEDVAALCTSNGTTAWRSVILLVPVRLGGDKMNEAYVPCVQAMLASKSCIGIIGGRPRHSLYFLGYQEDKVIYMDPHYCQDVVDTHTTDFSVESFHCSWPRKMSFARMDPSCTIGFYCKTRHEFDSFVENIKELTVPERSPQKYPVFLVANGSSASNSDMTPDLHGDDRILHVVQHFVHSDGTVRRNSEDYVML